MGIPTHAPDPGDPYPGDALRIVQAQTGLAYLGMHQRLDADTSGVLLFAAWREANKALAAAFEGRSVRKVYLALVHGTPAAVGHEGMIDAPITARTWRALSRDHSPTDPRGAGRRGRGIGCWTTGQESGVRSQESGVETSRPSHSLLELIPETGRPHQIRVHLAHLGCPVVGDPLYGPADRPAPWLYPHAYQLTLPHPATGQPVTYTAPAPDVLRADAGGSVEDGSRQADYRADGHAACGATADENVGRVGNPSYKPVFRAADAHAAGCTAVPAAKYAAKHPERSRGGGPGAVEGRRAIVGARPHPSTSAGSPMPASAQDALFFRLGVTHIRDAMAAPGRAAEHCCGWPSSAARPWRPIRRQTSTGW